MGMYISRYSCPTYSHSFSSMWNWKWSRHIGDPQVRYDQLNRSAHIVPCITSLRECSDSHWNVLKDKKWDWRPGTKWGDKALGSGRHVFVIMMRSSRTEFFCNTSPKVFPEMNLLIFGWAAESFFLEAFLICVRSSNTTSQLERFDANT